MSLTLGSGPFGHQPSGRFNHPRDPYHRDVRREAEPVRGRICFYNERTDVGVDGEAEGRVHIPWSR